MKKGNSKIALNKLKIAKLTNLSMVHGGGDTDDVARSVPLILCPGGTQGNGNFNANIAAN